MTGEVALQVAPDEAFVESFTIFLTHVFVKFGQFAPDTPSTGRLTPPL
jgi:hypothetical protein